MYYIGYTIYSKISAVLKLVWSRLTADTTKITTDNTTNTL